MPGLYHGCLGLVISMHSSSVLLHHLSRLFWGLGVVVVVVVIWKVDILMRAERWREYGAKHEEREPILESIIRSLMEPHGRQGGGTVGARGLEDTERVFSTPQLSLAQDWSCNLRPWMCRWRFSAYTLWLLDCLGDSWQWELGCPWLFHLLLWPLSSYWVSLPRLHVKVCALSCCVLFCLMSLRGLLFFGRSLQCGEEWIWARK